MPRRKAQRSPVISSLKFSGIGIVRDKDGVPKIDDPDNIPPKLLMHLTRQDRILLGMDGSDLVRDAQGCKRVTRISESEFRAEEQIVAASQISIDGKVYKLGERRDLAPGEIIRVKHRTPRKQA